MSRYSLDFRKKIVEAYEKGDTSIRKVAKRFLVSPDTVRRLV
ncbi:MAG: helix-turn-helix domain-containing protein, partial [Limnospira maxima]